MESFAAARLAPVRRVCTRASRTARSVSGDSARSLVSSPAMPAASRLFSQTTGASIFDPYEIRGLRLPNRVLMAPMEKNLCTSDGVMTQRYIDYLVARARGPACQGELSPLVHSKSA